MHIHTCSAGHIADMCQNDVTVSQATEQTEHIILLGFGSMYLCHIFDRGVMIKLSKKMYYYTVKKDHTFLIVVS